MKQTEWSSARPAGFPSLAAGKNGETGLARAPEPPRAAERRGHLSQGVAMNDPARGGVLDPGFAGGRREDSQAAPCG